MLQSAIRQFVPKPIKTYLQETLCDHPPAANDTGGPDYRNEEGLLLLRHESMPWGTFGKITLPSETSEFDDNVVVNMAEQSHVTLENPWVNNKKKVSCIPDGVYDMKMRTSAVVKRASGGAYSKGWEVKGVPGRTYIMFHPGNWPEDTEGCIMVGKEYAMISDKPGISDSRASFQAFMGRMEELYPDGEASITIKTMILEDRYDYLSGRK